MKKVTLRNESLGLSMTKATINGIDVVLAENIREALEWDTMQHMLYGLKDGKEVLKMRISDLDSTFKELSLNLVKTSEKGGRPQKYVYFLTRQGVTFHPALFLLQTFFLYFYENSLKNMQSGACYICPTWCGD